MSKELIHLLPKRFPNAHKGTYGRLLFIGGCKTMTGCSVLAAMGALRSGVGILECACEAPVISVLQQKVYESVYTPIPDPEEEFEACCNHLLSRLCDASALAIGPGLAGGKPRSLRGECVRDLITILGKRALGPMVLDADGLTVFEEAPSLFNFFEHGLVITPHPGEFSVLTGRSLLDIQNNRCEAASQFAKEHNCTVLLKGHQTVVASSKGELYVNSTGNPYMARGGSGDVLTGMIGSLLAQGLSPFDAASLGAYLHGGAGDLAAKDLGLSMLPSDLPLYIGKFIDSHSL